MAGSLFSSSWYRVARLKPRIRSHAKFHRHQYRGQLWYILQDPSTGQAHRLTPSAYHLAGLMNGERTTQEIWEAACEKLGDESPTQDETIRLLGLLHSSDVLRCDVSPDIAELWRRCQRRESSRWNQRLLSPMSVKIPLFEPDEFLNRWLPLVRPLFSWFAALAWCLLVGLAVFVAAANWTGITEGSTEVLLDPRNLLLLWFVFPVVKLLHELGHAFATKMWGGEVHDIGIMFLVLVPIPYVDASSASVLPDKWQRVMVGAAGLVVELFLAAIALFVWLNVEPGTIRSIAYNVMWIGGASTLLFNGNPLLKFDAYYMLADAIEIPNLYSRSRDYLTFLVQRHAFGLQQIRCPVQAPGESAWFVGYGLASFVYRILILFGIALFVSGKFFVVGVMLAMFVIAMGTVVPLCRGLSTLLTGPHIAPKRARAVGVSACVALAALLLLLVVPAPLMTRAEGIVWPPDGAQVRARADGFVLRVLVEPNSMVDAGDPLVLTRDPTLETRVSLLRAQLRELRARHHKQQREDLVRAQIIQEEIAAAEVSLAQARERVGEVIIRSPAHGSFLMPGAAADLVGRFVEQGELIGYVVGSFIDTARVVVPQSDVALVRDRTQRVEVRLSSAVGRVLPASIRRQVPAATDRLPSPALGTLGGGLVPVDVTDPEHLRTLENVFQLDVSLPREAGIQRIGERVYVRFHHGSEPLGARFYRALRRLFLRRVGV